MKKGLIIIGIAIAAIAVYFLFFVKEETPPTEEKKDEPLAQSKNSAAFNQSLNQLLNEYFSLKEALVNWDSAKAKNSADSIISLTKKVAYDSLQADTTIIATAKNFSESIAAEAMGLSGEASIEEQRHAFYTLSENLYNLLRTVRYDQQVIYHDKCPMAFGDDKEGYWLSNAKEIVNPYLGAKHPKYHSGMLNCGDVEDSLDFR